MSTDTLTIIEVDARTTNDDGDHDRFSHYVNKDEMTKAYIMGTPVTALCGKVWVPTRDPDKYPICPDCKKIFDSLPKE